MQSYAYIQQRFLDQLIVESIAAQLTMRAQMTGGLDLLAERRDLQPVAEAVLGDLFPDRLVPNRKVVIPIWERVGNVDLTVSEAPGTTTEAGLIELKWSGDGSDKLYEGLWDAMKLSPAQIAGAVIGPRAYLLTGAPKTVWESSSFADLFETAVHDPAQLCLRRLTDRKRTIAWDDLLRGGYDSYPHWVPAKIATNVCGRASVGESYELRAVEITVPECEGIDLKGGWPNGNRPGEARHPRQVAPPADGSESKFVDTLDDIEIDPATLPENIALLRDLGDEAS
jgi:hypothetical protein